MEQGHHSPQEHEAWEEQPATESQAEGDAEQVTMRPASPGPRRRQILGGPIPQSLFKPSF